MNIILFCRILCVDFPELFKVYKEREEKKETEPLLVLSGQSEGQTDRMTNGVCYKRKEDRR